MKRVAIVFGGKSPEHEVSIVSGESVIRYLPREKYQVIEIGITRDGLWLSGKNTLALLKSNHTEQATRMPPPILQEVDIVFPVLHGPFGEDGTIQGLCEMLDIPYVGASVLASAIGMDKSIAKLIWNRYNLPQVPYMSLSRQNYFTNARCIEDEIKKTFTLPLFVKPACLGSSIGVAKVKSYEILHQALLHAFDFDNCAIVEHAVDAREIEIGIMGNFDDIQASIPGEVLVAGEFYDFNDKYIEGKSRTKIVDDFSPRERAYAKKLAIDAFKSIKGCGFARVDLFLERSSRIFYLNEVNTIPGFTSISMFPKLWEASGVPYPLLLDRLIKLGFEHFEERKKNRIIFESGSTWYKS